MARQRDSKFFLFCFLVCPLSACSGGDGASSQAGSPNAAPKLADQSPSVADRAPTLTEPAPPDDTQPAAGIATAPAAACNDICAFAAQENCQFDANGCLADCLAVPSSACGAQVLALLSCVVPMRICPDQLTNLQQNSATYRSIVASCDNQLAALVACEPDVVFAGPRGD